MCSIKSCAVFVPVLAVLGSVVASLLSDGRAWDLFPAWNIEDMPDLSGKTAIVTGPTIGGIGHESAKELARQGAHVVLAGRSRSKGEAALRELFAVAPNAKAEFMELDLGSLKSVQNFAKAFKSNHSQLHILMNNAGVMANPFTLTEDGLESQFATNHLGHFLLTKLLLPTLEASAPSRVVTTSSAAGLIGGIMASAPTWLVDGRSVIDFDRVGSDFKPFYEPWRAYLRSKFANVLFAKGLDRRLNGKAIYSNSCNPGGIKTNLQVHVKKDLSSLGGQLFDAFLDSLGLPLRKGALTQLYLATSPDIENFNIRGKFLAPQALQRGEPPLSNDEALQDKLWDASEKLIASFL